jgi:hypothetical protein
MAGLNFNSREFDADEITQEIGDSIDEQLESAADQTVIAIKQSLDTPYPPASMPGESPHYRSRTLIKSIKRTTIQNHQVTVYSDDPKAALLEYGTSTMDPRPFWEPEIQKLEAKINKITI